MTGAITNGNTLALTVTGASDKLLLDAASAATSLSFNGSTGTLELNTNGNTDAGQRAGDWRRHGSAGRRRLDAD